MKFVSKALDCPIGWDGYGNSCYKVVFQSILSRGLNWENARRDCLDSGGDLVSIASQSEMSFVSNKSLSNQHYWIGLNDRLSESRFVWSDGTPYNASVYSNWRPGEPNDRGGEDCVELYRTRWNDNGCQDEFGYICEIPKGIFFSQCGILDLKTMVPCRCCRLKCILDQNDFKVSLQGNESRTVVGLVTRKGHIWDWIHHMLIIMGGLRDLTANASSLRKI